MCYELLGPIGELVGFSLTSLADERKQRCTTLPKCVERIGESRAFYKELTIIFFFGIHSFQELLRLEFHVHLCFFPIEILCDVEPRRDLLQILIYSAIERFGD